MVNTSRLSYERKIRKERDSKERRTGIRFPIEREVRYRSFGYRSEEVAGCGKTVNISSAGVFFTSEQLCLPGTRLELYISWPASIDPKVSLKLVARGRVVRSGQAEDGQEFKTAIEIDQYEFRRQAEGFHAA